MGQRVTCLAMSSACYARAEILMVVMREATTTTYKD